LHANKGEEKMLFKTGVDVYSSDNEKIGSLDRVVMDPKSKEVTHIVVKEGFLFTEDKVVPMDLVGSVTEERISLQGSKEHLDELPEFEETHYVRPHDTTSDSEVSADTSDPVYWYPPVDLSMGGYGRYPVAFFPQSLYVQKIEKNIPDGTIALAQGAKVVAEDGEHVGNIETLITDPKDDRVIHMVISSGLLLKERKVIPATWIDTVSDEEVRLSVDSHLLERLPEYHPQG
jgi:uncharacterized protein YrrD